MATTPFPCPIGHRVRLGASLSIGVFFAALPLHAAPPASSGPVVSRGHAASEPFRQIYQNRLDALKTEIAADLPQASEPVISAWNQARENLGKARLAAESAAKDLDSLNSAKALVDHAKGKWIGGAEKAIAQAHAALAAAANDAERDTARKELAKWEADKAEGLKALAERTVAYESAKRNEPAFRAASESAAAALAAAGTAEQAAADAVFAEVGSVLNDDARDVLLVEAALLAHATPQGLAEFACLGPGQAALVDKLRSNNSLMRDMLLAGGARFGQYGRAMQIYTEIQKASARASGGSFQRLALATALEHARPITESRPNAQQDPTPAFVDPVKRYLHYEAASLAGELDPAFPSLAAWDYRHVVNCDAPDEILAWGRQMLRNYRPDHIQNADSGWRYVAAVRTEVPYGSQNVKFDDPALHSYQNIIRNGGVCGRRAFFGRFILRAFGIPTWGVTQRGHAAVSHWTPKGWVVNLGASFQVSWWDKDDVPLSGTQFLRETQARAHEQEYIRVLRAEWLSRILGEETYNERRKIVGGFWSRIASHLSGKLAEKSPVLGPLGKELAEANDKQQKIASETVSASDQLVSVAHGVITIPAVAHGKSTTGKAAAMKSYSGGMQLHALGGYDTVYEFDAPAAGTYQLTAKVATVQTGQVFVFQMNGNEPAESPAPYTLGMWEDTQPVTVTVPKGKNTLRCGLKAGSRGVTIRNFTLSPVR